MKNPKPTSSASREDTIQRTVKLPVTLDQRVARAMEKEGVLSFSDFARVALVHRCREIEREHGVGE